MEHFTSGDPIINVFKSNNNSDDSDENETVKKISIKRIYRDILFII